MQYRHSDIFKGLYTDIDVWVCGYYYRGDDYSMYNPLRNVVPTKVRMTISLPGPNQISHFPHHYVKLIPYDKKGNLKSKPLSLFDTTAHPGFLEVFDNELECRIYYADLCDKHIKGLSEYVENVKNRVNRRIEEITITRNKYK